VGSSHSNGEPPPPPQPPASAPPSGEGAPPPPAPGSLFAGLGEAKDGGAGAGGEEGSELEEVEAGPWLMRDHPIFSRWFAALAAGSSRAALAAELAPAQWNAALLDVPADAPVPEGMPATDGTPLSAWAVVAKFTKMAAMGLPRAVVEHAMAKEGLNAALLDAPPGAPPPATLVAPPRRGRRKRAGPQVKKLHWVPVRGPVEGTWWGGPPGDLIAAAARLVPDGAEFARLFVADPDAAGKKGREKGGAVCLVDARRAQNCAIALAKLKAPVPAVAECLRAMSARAGGVLLSAVELANLCFLTPTEEEARLVAG
jgi:hypothetical protein